MNAKSTATGRPFSKFEVPPLQLTSRASGTLLALAYTRYTDGARASQKRAQQQWSKGGYKVLFEAIAR
jgi:hypothetical protein